MNLTIEPTQLPAPRPLPPPAPPTRRRHRWLIAGGAALAVGVVAVVAVGVAVNDDDTTANAAAELTVDPADVADLDVSDAGDDDASTGNASVDLQIVEAVWEGPDGKVALCPVFRDVQEAMPSLSDGEIFDMGVSMSDDMGGMTPAQIARMRELVLSEC